MTFIKRFLPKSLLGRSLLILVMPLVLLQVIATYIFYERHWSTITQRLANSLAGDVALIVTYLEDYPDPVSRKWIFEMAASRLHIRAEFLPGARLADDADSRTDSLDRMLGPQLD